MKKFFAGCALFVSGGLQIIVGVPSYTSEFINDNLVYFGGLFQIITGLLMVSIAIYILSNHEKK